jgi:type VI secretion system secreted protein VgrG
MPADPADNDAHLSGLSQSGRSIAIDTILGEDAVLLTAANGVDKLSACFVFTVEFLTQADDDRIRSLIGTNVTIWLNNQDAERRQPINGYIRNIVDRPTRGTGLYAYRAEIVPRLWFLERTSDCRIFQNMTYPDIVRQVLEDYGVNDVRFSLGKTDYPVTEYCVQYRESALAFISRLMEQVGIFYFFEHNATAHTLVITDTNHFADVLNPEILTLEPNGHYGTVHSVATETSFFPGAWILSDYDFTGPTKQMDQNAAAMRPQTLATQHERFDFPGGYTDQGVGEWLARLRLEEEEAHASRTMGTGAEAAMLPGYRFQLDRLGTGELVTFLLTEVRQNARENSYFNMAGEPRSSFATEFVAIDAKVPFRPARVTPKSVMRGAQTAVVVSDNPNDPIMVDEYGRVKVHFFWDRRGNPNNGNTSCWVRVSQNSAGAGFGGIATPHVGQEVVVDFLEGDPDRPLIVGRVHNSDKFTPVELPAHKNKTITRDHGGNQIMMDGESGGKHLTFIAPGNLNHIVYTGGPQGLSSQTAGPLEPTSAFDDIVLNPNKSDYDQMKADLTATQNVDAATSDKASDGNSDKAYSNNYNSYVQDVSNSYKGGNNNSWTMGSSYSYNKYCSVTITEADSTSVVLGTGNSFIGGLDAKVVGLMDFKGVGIASFSLVGVRSASGVGVSSRSSVGWWYTSEVGGNAPKGLGSDSKFVTGSSYTNIDGPIIKYNKGRMLDYRDGPVIDLRPGTTIEWKHKKIELASPKTLDLAKVKLEFDDLKALSSQLSKETSLTLDGLVAVAAGAGTFTSPVLVKLKAIIDAGKAKIDDADLASQNAAAFKADTASVTKLIDGDYAINTSQGWKMNVGVPPPAFASAVQAATASAQAAIAAECEAATARNITSLFDDSVSVDDMVATMAYTPPDDAAAPQAAAAAITALSQGMTGLASFEASATGTITMKSLDAISIQAALEASFCGIAQTTLGKDSAMMSIKGTMISVKGPQIMLG